MAAPDPCVWKAAGSAWAFLNSEFVSALLGALAGALAGAYGGQRIVEQQATKKRLIEEVRATNAAIALVLFVMNTTITVKRQHIQGLVDAHRTDRARFDALRNKPGKKTFKFAADWETLPITELPLEPLRQSIYARIDASASAISVFAMLVAVSRHLDTTIQQRNEFISDVHGRALSPPERLQLYFGLQRADGVIDARYPTMLNAISGYADGVIIFAAVLAALLIGHGEVEAKKLGKGAPKVNNMNLKAAFEAGLIPDPAEYAQPLKGVGIDGVALLSKFR